ncbi:MAG: hypothetical protein RL660_1369 [Bacteroidota bacterium]
MPHFTMQELIGLVDSNYERADNIVKKKGFEFGYVDTAEDGCEVTYYFFEAIPEKKLYVQMIGLFECDGKTTMSWSGISSKSYLQARAYIKANNFTLWKKEVTGAEGLYFYVKNDLRIGLSTRKEKTSTGKMMLVYTIYTTKAQ